MAYIVTSETSLSGEGLAAFDMPIPSGHQADDLLVAIITQDTGGTVIAAAGWTQISTQAAVQGQRTTAFYKFATGSSEADLSLTGATDEWIVNISVIRGADLSTPINVSVRTNSANSTTAYLDSGTVTTTEDNCLVLYACGFDSIFKLIPENPSTLMMLSRETDFVGCTQVVGYINQITAGTTPNVRFLSEVASEGGNALVIAIQDADPANALLSPTITQNYSVFKLYGGITTATAAIAAFTRHDAITWDVATTLTPADIDGLTIYDGTFTQITFQDVNRPWGSMTGLSIGGSAINNTGRWVGATHAVTSTDFTNKIFSIEFQKSAVSTSRFGAKGCIVVFEDSLGEWVAFTLSIRAGLIAAVSNTCYIDIENTPQLDASGSIDWSDITRVGYLYHKRTTSTTAHILRIKNALLHDKTVFVDGNINDPCSPAKLQQALEGWGGAGLASVQGGGQGLSRAGVQYGNGSRKTYVSSTATSYEMPLRENASFARRFWRIPDNVVGAEFRLLASANDVVDMTAGVMAVDVEQDWTIDASSSTSASYNFSGLSVIGWNVTHNVAGITINGATFKECHIALNGGLLSGCGISALKSSLQTNNPANIINCSFTSAGTGHAIEITATGTFDMTGNTFTGYGADASTDAAIYNNSGGAVTINIPLGGQVPTVRNGAGASTSVVSPTTVDITGAGTDSVEMRLLSDHSVLESRIGSGQINAAAHIGSEVYFARVVSGQTIASSYTDPITITSGDNGTIALFVGDEVQIGNIDAVAEDVWTYSTRTLTSGGGGGGGGGGSGDDAATIYTYFTSASRQDAFKADVSGLATQASVDTIGANVDAILVDTGTTLPAQITGLNNISVADIRTELSTELGRIDVAVSSRNSVAPDNASITAILADTSELQTNQGNWLTATGFATPTDVTNATTSLNDISTSDIRTELSTELGRIDTTISSRLASASYITPPTTAEIESALLNEGDGQQLIDAMVVAIGNTNVNEVTLVAAIRSDLERNGGLLDNLPVLSEIEASTVLAKESTSQDIKKNTNLIPATL